MTIKYSVAGVPLWTNLYNGPANLDDRPTAIAVDSSGNVFVTGSSPGSGSSYDYATIKYSGSSFLDIGLRVYDGVTTNHIAVEAGTPTSPFRINQNGTNYGVLLVATNDPNASKIRIQTSSGIKAWQKLP